MPRAVQTFRVSRDLLRRAAKLDGLRPAEWARLVIERAARERVAQAERDHAAVRILRRIERGEWRDESREEAERADRIRHEK